MVFCALNVNVSVRGSLTLALIAKITLLNPAPWLERGRTIKSVAHRRRHNAGRLISGEVSDNLRPNLSHCPAEPNIKNNSDCQTPTAWRLSLLAMVKAKPLFYFPQFSF
jgi:hypothetical protein